MLDVNNVWIKGARAGITCEANQKFSQTIPTSPQTLLTFPTKNTNISTYFPIESSLYKAIYSSYTQILAPLL